MRDMGEMTTSIHRAIGVHLAIFSNSFGSTGDGSHSPNGSQVEGDGLAMSVLHMYPVSVHIGRGPSRPSGPPSGDEDQRQMCVMGHPQQGGHHGNGPAVGLPLTLVASLARVGVPGSWCPGGTWDGRRAGG